MLVPLNDSGKCGNFLGATDRKKVQEIDTFCHTVQYIRLLTVCM